MGILGRINTVIRSNVNELLDKMSDPAKEIELLVLDMEKSLQQAKQEVVSVTAGAKRAASLCDELQGTVDTWLHRAEQAVRASDDDLARQALQRKLSTEAELEEARRAHREQLAYVDQLKAALKELEARLQQIKLRKETLKQRARALKQGEAGLEPGRAFDEFDRIEDKIQALETEVELGESLDARDVATAAKFARLEQQEPQVEDALAALKRKLDADG